MVFIHIDSKNFEEKDENNKTNIDNLNNIIHGDKKNKVFILYYMEGCGPCNSTRPEWEKIKNVLKDINNSKDIAIVDIDQVMSSKIKGIKEPSGFPTIRFITNGGKEVENYEDSGLNDSEKNRSIDSFVKWIQLKSGKQNGGLMINSRDDDAFNYFLKNSKISFLTKGSFGITFKATLNPGVVSKYTRLESSSSFDYGDEVRTIIIKIGFIHDASKGQEEKYVNITSSIKFTTGEIQTFKDEVNIQTDIFLKTMNYLQPICPAIIYSKIYNDDNGLDDLFDQMFHIAENTNTQSLIQQMYNLKHKKAFYNMGVIGMEFADSYTLLYNLRKDVNSELYKNMTLYILLKLAMSTGYTHGDFHSGNIFINTSSNNYFKGINGKPLLIDFGQSQKIPIPILNYMKEQYKNGNYTEALKQLCDIDRPDEVNMREYPSFYGFACGTYDFKTDRVITNFPPDINSKIAQLIETREEAIDDIVNLFKTKHDSDPDKFPLLPLSNAVKKLMYSGLIGGRKNRKISNKKTRKNKKTHKNKKRGKWSRK